LVIAFFFILFAPHSAIPGETNASGTLFRFAGWLNYWHAVTGSQVRVGGRPTGHSDWAKTFLAQHANGIPDHFPASQMRPKRPRCVEFESAPPFGKKTVTDKNPSLHTSKRKSACPPINICYLIRSIIIIPTKRKGPPHAYPLVRHVLSPASHP
jgi:hypothetical protein